MIASIIDTHVHFLDPARLAYPWAVDYPAMQRAFLPAEYADAFAGIPVEAMVFVEVSVRPDLVEEEVAWVEELALAEPRIKAIVANANLVMDEKQRTALLERQFARPMVRAIRHVIQWEPLGFCLQPSFIEGVRTVGRLGGHFELCLFHTQMDDVIQLVKQCPEVRFMLDHAGKPHIKEDEMEPWRTQLTELAGFENVSCKISGMFTEADLICQPVEVLLPYVEHVVASFGPRRVLYGSDWPVVTIAAEARRWFEFTRQFTAAWSQEERDLFYRGNAEACYGWGRPFPGQVGACFGAWDR